ncbi:heart- and neural crest derivatives-expressed protein 2-like [Neocloeon triangulifer]|uniref:heart- and neural crest derivatives-expressed protein 2-like n=1 Tax=Neocloeon triangulifer TaxID=2078957 RepID=UPI00286EC362|nr:heart- and neural crest derivatives-expressed protein 2-like [Neocloeon triangulifer]
MSLDIVDMSCNAYSAPVDNGTLYYSRYYPSPQHDYYGGGSAGGAWADCSPTSSGRSVSPCDEYQPPLIGGAAEYHHLSMAPMTTSTAVPGLAPVRTVKRRSTANKKERRRTQSINTAFSSLREHIPGIPGDTKLSKIKTLKHAIAYINHLMEMLNGDKISIDTARSAFRADLHVAGRRQARQHLGQHQQSAACDEYNTGRCPQLENIEMVEVGRKNKGRTGWPQHVWVHNELKQ